MLLPCKKNKNTNPSNLSNPNCKALAGLCACLIPKWSNWRIFKTIANHLYSTTLEYIYICIYANYWHTYIYILLIGPFIDNSWLPRLASMQPHTLSTSSYRAAGATLAKSGNSSTSPSNNLPTSVMSEWVIYDPFRWGTFFSTVSWKNKRRTWAWCWWKTYFLALFC